MCDHIVTSGLGKILLLDTQFTMEDGYYAEPIRAVGIEVAIPDEPDRVWVEAIQTQLVDGIVSDQFRVYFADLLQRHAAQDREAVVT